MSAPNHTTSYTEPAPKRRPSWMVELRPERPADQPEKLLRMALKRWLRRDGLRVVKIRPVESEASMSEHTNRREQLVQRWRDITQRLELARGDERSALVQELRQVESDAMALIRDEQGETAQVKANA